MAPALHKPAACGLGCFDWHLAKLKQGALGVAAKAHSFSVGVESFEVGVTDFLEVSTRSSRSQTSNAGMKALSFSVVA